MADARLLLDAGDLAGAEARIRGVLDQAPASDAARALAGEISAAIEAERTSAETQEKVSALVAEGRQLYRRSDYVDAAARFREALELDPQNEIAISFLDLAIERSQRPRTTSSQPKRAAVSTAVDEKPAAPSETRAPVGVARITLTFNSPISVGSVSVTLDGELLADVPFDFTDTGFLGFKRKGKGQVRRVILTPAGQHTIGVQLLGRDRRVLGSRSFSEALSPESRWSLRVDLPREDAEPNFFLVQSAR
jgi:hypothetical protein